MRLPIHSPDGIGLREAARAVGPGWGLVLLDAYDLLGVFGARLHRLDVVDGALRLHSDDLLPGGTAHEALARICAPSRGMCAACGNDGALVYEDAEPAITLCVPCSLRWREGERRWDRICDWHWRPEWDRDDDARDREPREPWMGD